MDLIAKTSAIDAKKLKLDLQNSPFDSLLFYGSVQLDHLSTNLAIKPTPHTKDWWDIKGVIKNLPPNHSNPNPFKAGDRSPFRDLPGGDKGTFIKIDPAHTYAIDGIGKSFLGSCIIMLVRMKHFGRGTYEKCLEVAYDSFLQFCSQTGKTTSITEFEYSTFKLPKGSFLIYHFIKILDHLFEL